MGESSDPTGSEFATIKIAAAYFIVATFKYAAAILIVAVRSYGSQTAMVLIKF